MNIHELVNLSLPEWDAYDLTLAGYAAERADGGDLDCDHEDKGEGH